VDGRIAPRRDVRVVVVVVVVWRPSSSSSPMSSKTGKGTTMTGFVFVGFENTRVCRFFA
jgi:hypothetical protein